MKELTKFSEYMKHERNSVGKTPMQNLRDENIIDFTDIGTYNLKLSDDEICKYMEPKNKSQSIGKKKIS